MTWSRKTRRKKAEEEREKSAVGCERCFFCVDNRKRARFGSLRLQMYAIHKIQQLLFVWIYASRFTLFVCLFGWSRSMPTNLCCTYMHTCAYWMEKSTKNSENHICVTRTVCDTQNQTKINSNVYGIKCNVKRQCEGTRQRESALKIRNQ